MPPHRPSTAGLRRVRWREHYDWLDSAWEPGQAVTILAPTGGGKTHLLTAPTGLLSLWDTASGKPRDAYPMLFIDAKDYDPLLTRFARRVDRLPSWPQRRLDRGRPWYRIKIPSLFSGATRGQQQRAVYDALRSAYREGGWVVVVDEFRPLLDLGLKDYAIEIWERGRTKEVTFVVGTQAPRFMPGHLYDQCSHAYMGQVTDKRTQVRLREIGGYSEELRAAIEGLAQRQFAYVSKLRRRPADRLGVQEIVKVGRLR
jgi:hypothetical protein